MHPDGPHPFAPWLALAFDQVPAPQASAAIAMHRQARVDAGLMARSYELVAPDPPGPLAAFLLPAGVRLTEHLRSLGQDPRGAAGVFVSLFVGQDLYFIESITTLDLCLKLTPPLALPGA